MHKSFLKTRSFKRYMYLTWMPLFFYLFIYLSVLIHVLWKRSCSHWHKSPGCRFSFLFENLQYFSPGIVSIRRKGTIMSTLNQFWSHWKICVWQSQRSHISLKVWWTRWKSISINLTKLPVQSIWDFQRHRDKKMLALSWKLCSANYRLDYANCIH